MSEKFSADLTMTPAEKRYCTEIFDRIERLRMFLNTNSLGKPVSPTAWHDFLSRQKAIQGNLSNDISFIATLLAKEYLVSRYPVSFDAAAKAQGAPGIDIDVTTRNGERIVAEIKTTSPYQQTDFGAQQVASFKKDFAKLVSATATHKFLFVTDQRAFGALKKAKYANQIPGITVILLPSGEETSN